MVNTYCIHPGDCLASLRTMADQSVQCCITSPPYWGLRDYGHDGQIGLEETPEAYVAQMVEVFREVRRVLKDDGTLWLNLGDSYARQAGPEESKYATKHTLNVGQIAAYDAGAIPAKKNVPPQGLKPKDIVGIPWRVAFALQADGWWLRQDIIWHKPNPMPESVTDRCTKAHEYVFLLTKSQRYYYDAEAVSEASVDAASYRPRSPRNPDKREGDKFFATKVGSHANGKVYATRNRRSVWTVTTKPYSGAHFAVMPEALVEPCLLAGSRPCDLVLDPFTGSGTVGAVAVNHGRSFVGCELNPDYIALARQRIGNVAPLFTQGVTCAER
jgi:DNA modification methylase